MLKEVTPEAISRMGQFVTSEPSFWEGSGVNQTTCSVSMDYNAPGIGMKGAHTMRERNDRIRDTSSRLIMTKRETAGYSIIELLVVFFILLCVSAMAIPNLNATLQNYRAMGDARGIAAQLALARMRAGNDK